MIRALPAVFLLCAVAGAQDIDSGALLSRVQEKVRANARTIPRFVCRQNIEREEFDLGLRAACPALDAHSLLESGRRPVTSDRATLDVMFSTTEELFAWPGSRRFDVSSPDKLLGGGLSGSGDFATWAISIFTSDATTFKYQGACGRERCVRFSYEVPQIASTYTIATSLHEAVLGYQGTFEADPETAELLSLTVIPTDVAKQLPEACAMSAAITYAKPDGAAGKFMLPAATDREYVAQAGGRLRGFRTHATYGGCREFSSESALKFDDDLPAERAGQPGTDPPALPGPGTELQVRIPDGIRADGAAGNDLEGVLVRAVKDQRGGTLPAGTILRGRITRLQTVHGGRRDGINVSIRFDTVMVRGTAVPLTLTSADRMDSRGAAVFSFDSTGAVLGKGLVSRWKIVQ